MPFRLLVPFSQEVFIRFTYRDREIGHDAAVFGASYDGISTRLPGHVTRLSPLRPPNLSIRCDVLTAEWAAGFGAPAACGVRTAAGCVPAVRLKPPLLGRKPLTSLAK